jgi:hypothetical protein
MTDKPAEYYHDWASRLNRLVSDRPNAPLFTPEFVAEAERRSGKDFGDVSCDELAALASEAFVNAALMDADADQFNSDEAIITAAMQRRGAATASDMVAMLSPTDDDYAEVSDAVRRKILRIGLELGLDAE